jgi:dihydrolipoamide dehydrogenase
VVIGSGPGGYVAAIRAAQLGMKTAVIESDRVGGRCLNYACIPAKAVLRVADVLTEIREASEFGIKVGAPEIDYAGITARRLKVVSTLTGGVAGLLKKNKIDLIEGTGAVVGAGKVAVDGSDEITAQTIVLATGSVKRSIPGAQFGGRVIGTEEAWALDELPASLAVVGAGASGSEIASAYVRLGSEVLLFEALERVLPTEDVDISKVAERGFKKQGITVHTNTLVEEIESGSDSVTFTYGGSGEGEVQWLVIAAGRGPDIEGLGLDAAGVKLDEKGLIEVDGAMRTSVEGVYAIGDLVPGPALAHKASDEGVIAIEEPPAWRRIRSSTSTSRGPRSVHQTSRASG